MTSTAKWWRQDALIWSSSGWSLELRGDELADVRRGDTVILRAVRAVVRDHGWNTVPVTVLDTKFTDQSLLLRLHHHGLGAEVISILTVSITDDDLRIEWDAENLRAFDTCRTGLVVLHPASDAGRAVTVTHSDGTVEQTAFPTPISPHQPIRDIRALRIDDSSTTLQFEGDVFEMEDQRNWSDASFKTYSRPLALPYPYPLTSGERIQQTISIQAPPSESVVRETESEITLTEYGAFPTVGVEASTAPDAGSGAGSPSTDGAFRIVELNLTTPTWPAALDRAAADGLPLDVHLVTDGTSGPLADAARALSRHRAIAVTPFDSILHVSDEASVTRTRAALETAGLATPVRGGARSHFTEFNREHHRLPESISGIVITTTPLFHSIDTEQLVEALAMQRLIATQTVAMAAGRPVHIGPVSLRPRFNNVATTPEPAPTRADLSEGYGAQFTGADDERQDAPELTAWTIASAAALAVPGVESLAWFETWGPRGLRDTTGVARPATDAIAALSAFAGRTLLSGESPDGLLWAVGARDRDGDEVLVANLDRTARRVVLAVPGGSPHTLDIAPGSWQRTTYKTHR